MAIPGKRPFPRNAWRLEKVLSMLHPQCPEAAWHRQMLFLLQGRQLSLLQTTRHTVFVSGLFAYRLKLAKGSRQPPQTFRVADRSAQGSQFWPTDPLP